MFLNLNDKILFACIILLNVILIFSIKGIDPRLDMFLCSDIGFCITSIIVFFIFIMILAFLSFLLEILFKPLIKKVCNKMNER